MSIGWAFYVGYLGLGWDVRVLYAPKQVKEMTSENFSRGLLARGNAWDHGGELGTRVAKLAQKCGMVVQDKKKHNKFEICLHLQHIYS